MVCDQNEFFDEANGRCELCSRLCFKAAIQGTVNSCRRLCSAYMKTQEQEHPSKLHSNFLWLEILGPVAGLLVIAGFAFYLVVYRKRRSQFPWQRRRLPMQESRGHQGRLATALERQRPTQDTEMIELMPMGQAPTDSDPPAYNPIPSGKGTASQHPLTLEIPSPGDGPDPLSPDVTTV